MQNAIRKIQQFKTNMKLVKAHIKLEQIYNHVLILMMITILSISLMALLRPISVQQHQQLYKIAHQSRYLKTQEMAFFLLAEPQVSMGQYLKLMSALQYEKNQANQLPAISSDE